MPDLARPWYVYMVLCNDGALYTGISVDVQRRFEQHRRGRGARFFRTRNALQLVYLETGHDRSSASRREWIIKRMSAVEKRALLGSDLNRLD